MKTNISFKHIGYLWLVGTCAAGLLLAFVFYDFMLSPQLESKVQLDNQIRVEKSRVTVVEAFAAAHPDTQQYLQELDREIVRVNTLLPERANTGETIAFLEDTAKATGVVFGAFSTDKSIFKNGFTETRVVFKVGGSYQDLLEYARRLDAGPRFMAVQAVEFHDRFMLNRQVLDVGGIQALLEKEFSSKGGLLGPTIVERGLLGKANLMVMNVYLTVVTQGRLPGAEAATNPPNAPTPPKS
ncbi:MAG: type 4a pilus biogenesis protein PilO [Negativicutes bacterium]|nr:type 4a pilus biogenesis protein PilO [Negativicutes bacterium]